MRADTNAKRLRPLSRRRREERRQRPRWSVASVNRAAAAAAASFWQRHRRAPSSRAWGTAWYHYSPCSRMPPPVFAHAPRMFASCMGCAQASRMPRDAGPGIAYLSADSGMGSHQRASGSQRGFEMTSQGALYPSPAISEVREEVGGTCAIT